MKTFLKTAITLISISSVLSCAGPKKINYDTAYKFSSYNYQKSTVEDEIDLNNTTPDPELYVSVKPEIIDDSNNNLTEIEANIYSKIGVSAQAADAMEISELKQRFNALNHQEKREIRKEIKVELKQLRSDVKDKQTTLDVDRVNEVSDLTRWSIIIGSVGLLLLILGAIFTGVLTFFGAIFIVGAAVLFILDQA